jgi:hypothetical protein
MKKCARCLGIMLVAPLALIGSASLSEEKLVQFVDVYTHNFASIGTRTSVCATDSEARYNYICQFRANDDFHAYKFSNDLRAYKLGRYRDRRLLARQGELRRPFVPGWSVAVLDGRGGNAANTTKFKFDYFLPAGGGVRFNTPKQGKLSYTVDLTGGRKGIAVYFRIGEAY